MAPVAGFEPATKAPSLLIAAHGGTEKGTVSAGISADLLEIAECWQRLPHALKQGVLAIVRSIKESRET